MVAASLGRAVALVLVIGCGGQTSPNSGPSDADSVPSDACVASAGDQPCRACLKLSCCDAYEQCTVSTDYQGYRTCVGDCADQQLAPTEDDACVQACITQYPIGSQLLTALLGCRDNNCFSGQCDEEIGGGRASDFPEDAP